MTKQCTHCGGTGRQYDADADTRGYHCPHCGGHGTDERSPSGRGKCEACNGTGIEPPVDAIACPDCEDDDGRGCPSCGFRGWVASNEEGCDE